MQHDVEQESSGLQDLESQQRDARGRLQEMEQQRSKLDGMLHDVKHKCQEESQLVRAAPPSHDVRVQVQTLVRIC